MLSHPSPGRSRLSPSVSTLRHSMPYVNYERSILYTHTHPAEKSSTQAQPESSEWTGPLGYGRRHRTDDAPFSLFDQASQDFRIPTHKEWEWMVKKYNASRIALYFPTIVIETESPPNPLPLTMATVAARFVPPPLSTSESTPLYDARPPNFANNYVAMRGPEDPLDFQFRKWVQPSAEQQTSLVRVLCQICNPTTIHILCPRLIVELVHDDGRLYPSGSLPRVIGGFSVHWHHETTPAFDGVSMSARQRLITPTVDVQDSGDYMQTFDGLSPGVRVSSGTATSAEPCGVFSHSTTAGLLLRDNHGHERVTVSNDGFLESDEVHHPTEDGTRIGHIDERFLHLDVALVNLDPSIRFTTKTYFGAKQPRRLLRSTEIVGGRWYAMDGMSTGVVFLQAQGLTLMVPLRPENSPALGFYIMRTYQGFGATGAMPRDGICGAVIVEDETDNGGVAGFVQYGNVDGMFSPCLDELIDLSWSVV